MSHQRFNFKVFLFSLSLLLCVYSQAAADTWYESYHKAEEALSGEHWAIAVQHLNDALEEMPESHDQVRTYGMRFISYFPYLKLGIAYYHLGQADAALQAFETEERQGEIEHSQKDKVELKAYRDIIRQAREKAEEEKQRQVRQVVTQSLAAAQNFEIRERFDDALGALAEVLAVEPGHQEATAARHRLLAAIAERQEQKERIDRFTRLAEQGKTEFGSEQYSAAAATFSRALELKSDDKIQILLEQAQRFIRAKIKAREDLDKRRQLISLILARASELENSGKLIKALNELQSVLALDPDNSKARSLKERILRTQAAQEAEVSRNATIRRLLADIEKLLKAGKHQQALRSANQVLALDPANKTALRYTAEVYAELSKILLATDAVPPTILLDNLGTENQGQGIGGITMIHTPEVLLTGTVYDSMPVEINFLDSNGPAGRVSTQSRKVQGVWITDFRFVHHIPPGVSAITVIAKNKVGKAARESRSFEYVEPFIRSVWFPTSIAATLAVLVLGLIGWRLHRRSRLIHRRFNPYIAGAPILERQRFFGRRQLFDYVLRRIANNSILLYGERRIGKTSFLHQLKGRLTQLKDPDHAFYPVFVDLQGTPQERFFSTLAADIFHELSPLLDGIQPDPSIDQDTYGYREFVKDIQRVIKTLGDHSTKKLKIVLLIDEVDELNDYDPRINQKLRSLFMRTFADNLVSVVSGVAIKKQWDREGSPWFNFFQEVEVKPLDIEEARALIELPMRGVFTFEKGVVDEIVRQTNSRPYLIQKLCSELVDRLHEERRRSITLSDVEVVSRTGELQ